MIQIKIIGDFADMDPNDLIAFATNTGKNITDNSVFVTSLPLVPTLEKLIEKVQAVNYDKKDHSENSLEKLSVAMKHLIALLYKFSHGVLFDSDNDESTISRSGFTLSSTERKKAAAPAIPIFNNFEETSENGVGIVSLKSTPNTRNYKAILYDMVGMEVASGSSYRKEIKVRNIPTDVPLQLSFSASGTNGDSKWSKPIIVKLPSVSFDLSQEKEELEETG